MKSVITLSAFLTVALALPATTPFQEVGATTAGYDAAADAKDTVAVLLQEGKDEGACASLADASIKEVEDSVSSAQKILDALDTGADCHKEGQAAVDQAQTALDNAKQAAADADAAAAKAASTPVKFNPVPFSSLKEGVCDTFFSDPHYLQAKQEAKAAKDAATKAAGAVTAAETALTAAKKAQEEAVAKCQNDVRCAYDKAWTAANEQNESNEKVYTKGKHMKCVLDGTPPADCQVGDIPAVKEVQLANGVPATCEEEGEENNEPPKDNTPVVPECKCKELVTPDFMQVETDMQTGTDWVTQYKINNPQGPSSPIPHPGGIISMAVRCGRFCHHANGLWTGLFHDTNKYKITHVNSFNEVPEDASILWDIEPKNSHSASEIDFMKNFLNRGGRLMMVGENNGCCKKENAIVTATVKALGGGVEVRNQDGGQSVLNQNDINDLQATEGVKGIQTAAWAALKVDKSVTEVLATNDKGDIFCADQMLGKGRVTIWADINPMSSSYLNNVDTKHFFSNLVHQGANFVEAVKNGQNPNEGGPCQC